MSELTANFGTLGTFKWQGHTMLTRTRGDRIKLWPPDHRIEPFAGATWPVDCEKGREAETIQKRIDDAANVAVDDSLTLTRDQVRGLTGQEIIDLIRVERPDWEVVA